MCTYVEKWVHLVHKKFHVLLENIQLFTCSEISITGSQNVHETKKKVLAWIQKMFIGSLKCCGLEK
jgi:hypothetical protein